MAFFECLKYLSILSAETFVSVTYTLGDEEQQDPAVLHPATEGKSTIRFLYFLSSW